MNRFPNQQVDHSTVTDATEYVLVVEASELYRVILTSALQQMGFHTIQAANAAGAWTTLDQSRHQKLVAVISDLVMPSKEGLELLRQIRTDDQYKNLIFVLSTLVSDRDYIFEAKRLQVNGYLLKPFQHRQLMVKLHEIFAQREILKSAG
jgi:DNA-binding response OmpR family regulator